MGKEYFARTTWSQGTPLRIGGAQPGDRDLIVTCTECSTSFQLDESRIPATGARVRCSRCKHAFFLAHPSASDSEAVHSIAEQAAQDPSPATPTPTADAGAAVQATGVAAGGSVGAPEPDLDEEDWQFSEEVRIEGDDEREEDAGADFGVEGDFGGGLDAEALSQETSTDGPDPAIASGPAVGAQALADDGTDSGLELDGADEPAPDPDPASEASRDESSFGSVDDFSSLMEDEDGSAEASAASAAAGASEAGNGESTAPRDSVASYSASGAKDDLGDPESWDLVGNDDPKPRKTRTASAPTRASGAIDEVIAEGGFGERVAADYSEEDAQAAPWLAAVGRVGHVVGWVGTLGLVGLIAFLGLKPEWTRWAEVTQTISSSPLQAETTRSGWIETSRAGPVLIFEGEVRNTGRSPVRPAGVGLALLDASGIRLPDAFVRVGVPVAERLLRETTPENLEDRARAATREFESAPLAPGETRAFQAVVLAAQLPDRARRVLLEIDANAATDSAPSPVAAASAPEEAQSTVPSS